MKGNISLADFITKVKDELVSSQCSPEEAFYELTDVELEVSFALAVTGKAKGKLVVMELGGESSATQSHRVRLKLKPVGNMFSAKPAMEAANSEEQQTDTSELPEGGNIASDKKQSLVQPKRHVQGGGGGGGGSFGHSYMEEKRSKPVYQKMD